MSSKGGKDNAQGLNKLPKLFKDIGRQPTPQKLHQKPRKEAENGQTTQSTGHIHLPLADSGTQSSRRETEAEEKPQLQMTEKRKMR
ncbi:hypothetical protein CAEBREN_14154 [Caenorhabditis brenneri]|uniref:Uncharacterized protein n=1 Tax=Caenorhabditis brenneri TaxID=135651 RepID=G0NAX2_CAEBE|nr:hypothetical protein CAEBREN_14154 [Caenorhabditis brenneri]